MSYEQHRQDSQKVSVRGRMIDDMSTGVDPQHEPRVHRCFLKPTALKKLPFQASFQRDFAKPSGRMFQTVNTTLRFKTPWSYINESHTQCILLLPVF